MTRARTIAQTFAAPLQAVFSSTRRRNGRDLSFKGAPYADHYRKDCVRARVVHREGRADVSRRSAHEGTSPGPVPDPRRPPGRVGATASPPTPAAQGRRPDRPPAEAVKENSSFTWVVADDNRTTLAWLHNYWSDAYKIERPVFEDTLIDAAGQ